MDVDCEVRCTDDVQENKLLKEVDKILSNKKKLINKTSQQNLPNNLPLTKNNTDNLLQDILNRKQTLKKSII